MPRRPFLPFLVALLLLLVAPVAAATTVGLGPAEAEVAFAPMPGCAVGVDDDLCAASRDPGADPGLGDDEWNAERTLQTLRLTLRAPGAPEQALVVEPDSFVVHHPVNGHLEATWRAANDARPDALKPYVAFEALPADDARLLVVHVTFPVPLVFPTTGQPWTESYVPVYSWECSWYFTGYANWDEACTYDGVRPLPNGVHSNDTTDRSFDVAAGLMDCDAYEDFPQACPALTLAGDANAFLAAAWRDALPNVRAGTGVERIEAGVGPS